MQACVTGDGFDGESRVWRTSNTCPAADHLRDVVHCLSLPRLPPNLPHPTRPLRHVLSLHQQFHTIKLLSQLLISRNLVHERVASSAKPRHLRQLPFSVPASFDRLRVHLPRDKMVIC